MSVSGLGFINSLGFLILHRHTGLSTAAVLRVQRPRFRHCGVYLLCASCLALPACFLFSWCSLGPVECLFFTYLFLPATLANKRTVQGLRGKTGIYLHHLSCALLMYQV